MPLYESNMVSTAQIFRFFGGLTHIRLTKTRKYRGIDDSNLLTALQEVDVIYERSLVHYNVTISMF